MTFDNNDQPEVEQEEINEEEVLEEEVEEVEEEEEVQEEPETDPRDAKIEELEAKLAKQGNAKRKATRAAKAKGVKEPQGLGYGEKAYLAAEGIKGTEEFQLIEDIMADTGKSLEDVIGNKFFKAEIESLRENRVAAEAQPKGTRRSGKPVRSTADYWIKKGELPPKDQPLLRREVVNAKIKMNQQNDMFAE